MITGFSDSRNPINDGEVAYLTDSTILSDEFAPVGVLNTLIDLNVQSKFDCAIMDGNHNAEYLVRELELLKPLLADLAFVVLDDVDEHWPSIQTVYNTSRNFGFTPKACDGRVGILEYHRPA